MGSGAARALTVRHALEEMLKLKGHGTQVVIEMETDRSAAMGMIHRQGVGRVRHLQARWLRHRELVHNKIT